MFTRKPQIEKTGLDELIDTVTFEMRSMDADSEEFYTAQKRLEKLYELKDKDRPKRVSPDTLLIVGANLLGIIIITQHERANVVTSKALGFVMKAR